MAENFREYLENLIDYHEMNNLFGTVKKHELVQGDVSKTAPAYFANNDDVFIVLDYFDMALYEPTKAALYATKPPLLTGSVVMLDELNNKDFTAETRASRRCSRV